MMVLRCGARVTHFQLRGAVFRASRCLAALGMATCLLSGCAITASNIRACRYANYFVEPEDPYAASDQWVGDPMRRAILDIASDRLRSVGMRVVADPSEAWWKLSASGLTLSDGSFSLSFSLLGSLKLKNHIFIAQLNDPKFPKGESTGLVIVSEIRPSEKLESFRFRLRIRRGVYQIWNHVRRRITALCELDAQLESAGWAGIEGLRNELIDEMKRARRERAKATQQKRLELEVEVEVEVEEKSQR